MESPVERWQVDLNGKLVEADYETVKRWIVEGRMNAGDKVKREASTGLRQVVFPPCGSIFSSFNRE